MKRVEANFEETVAFYVLRILDGHELVDGALRGLEGGLSSPSLAILASETNPIMSDAAPLFEKALTELKTSIPSKLDALLIALHFFAKAILDARLTPSQGAGKLAQAIRFNIEYPSRLLSEIVDLAFYIEDLPHWTDVGDISSAIEDCKREIRRAAEEILKIKKSAELEEE